MPLKASLKLFDEAGMDNLVDKSTKLTGYLEFLLQNIVGDKIEIMTPTDPKRRGCQLSIIVKDGNPSALHEYLKSNHVIIDFRKPNILRIAPTPLYNSYHEVCRFAQLVKHYFNMGPK